MELIKPIVRLGNSAGVILPREWLNGEARVTLVRRPQNIKQEILEILEPIFTSVISIALVGSYARNEEKSGSDIDVLVITSDIDETIRKGKYEIMVISKDTLEKSLETDAIPIIPMLKEAKPIINSDMIDFYRKAELTQKNIRWHIETTFSALKVIKEAIQLAKERNEKVSDNIVYSLILRMRQVFIIDCLIKKKQPTTSGLLRLIKDLAVSADSYNAYKRSKEGKKAQKSLPAKEAESIYDYVKEKISEQQKWTKRKS